MARPPLPPAEAVTIVPFAEIAKGGMGSVQLARADGGRLGGTFVAVKRLHPNIAQDPQFVGMFLDEAWMTAALKSPNVVEVMAWGEDKSGMYLAVELVQGISLSRLIKEARGHKESFAERTVAFIGSQICAGLAAAHALTSESGKPLGLVHRDLTPGNILAGFDGIVKIADFGIAKAEERITHTMTGTLKGKPAYMAPEQARGGKVDARADIFSFGVMLFELLAGRRPWTAKGTFEVMMEIANTAPPDLEALRGGLSPVFLDVVGRCLAKKPEERFSSASEIQARLDGWRAERGFVADDLASLSAFVRRNATRQIGWFEQALRGDFARGSSPTFKDIEEKLDEPQRDPLRATIRPAAGAQPAASAPRAASTPPTPSVPPAPTSGRGVPPPPPSRRAGPPPSPSSRGLSAPPPRPTAPPLRPPEDALNRTIAVNEGDFEVVGVLVNPGPPLAGGGTERMHRPFGGTELLRTSPFAAPDFGTPPPPSPPAGLPLPPSSQGHGAMTFRQQSVPFQGGPGFGAAPPHPSYPSLPGVYTGHSTPPGVNPLLQQPSAPPRSSRGIILALTVLLIVVSAAAFAAWRHREHPLVPAPARSAH